jgi:hypothetical protein
MFATKILVHRQEIKSVQFRIENKPGGLTTWRLREQAQKVAIGFSRSTGRDQ